MIRSYSPLSAIRERRARARTLRVVDLLHTKVQSVRIELLGEDTSIVDRLGTWLFYLPLLLVGYLLILGSALTVVHSALGWGPTLLLFGVVHFGVGAWGVLRAPSIGIVSREAVPEPSLGNAAAPSDDAIPRVQPSAVLPLPFATSTTDRRRVTAPASVSQSQSRP